MPQDNLRASVYRSFVTCDDPKGVVDCGTIRKYKSNSKRSEEKAGSRKIPKNINSSSSSSSACKNQEKEMVSEKGTEDFHNPSSFQLMEVSKGAQKLNQVIDSWSKGMNFDGSSKEVAKDLLKGALDLQDSLTMLGKLQEASQYMAKLKKKQKEKTNGERTGQVGLERTKSLHFTEHNHDMGFQKPRLSDYGCTRYCFEQKEKSLRERVCDVGIERTNSHHFMDHNYQTGSQKPRLCDHGCSSYCLEQKQKSTGEWINEVGTERTNSHHFADHNYQTIFQKLRLSADEKSRGERFHEVRIQRTNSHYIGDHNHETGFHKQSLSADGNSRDCFDELRIAISDSLTRQNLLPPTCIEKRDFYKRSAQESAPDFASTSSSKSSMVNSHEFASSNSSFSSTAPNKPKGSNLIAKLIGLEEIHRKQLENGKTPSPRRAVFDIDMPKARKPQSAVYKVGTEQVKLKEMVQNMQFKGLLKSNSAEGLVLQSHHSNVSDYKKRSSKDVTPIVIMRHWRTPSAEEHEPRVQNLIREIEALDMYHSEGGFNSVEMCRRVKKGGDTPIKRISQEGDKLSKLVQEKTKETAVKTKGKLSSNKSKASVPVNQQHRKKAVEKKVDMGQKVAPCRKKPAEVEHVKAKGVIKSQDEAKVTSPRERKPKMGSIVAKSRTSQQKFTTKHTKTAISQNNCDQRKNPNNERPVKAPLVADFVVEKENVRCEHGDKLVDLTCENEADTTVIKTATGDQLIVDEGTYASEIQIDERDDSSRNLYNVLPLTTQNESFIKSAEETKHCITQNITETKCFRTETNAIDLFLSSPLLLSYAEGLFDFNSNDAIHLQPTSLNNHETDYTRPLLDCATELLQNKILRCKQTVHPLLFSPMSHSKSSTSLSELAEEVSDGIEYLRSYSKSFCEKFPEDSILSVLERDLRCWGVVTGGWDLGWKLAFTVDEVEKISGDIQKMVFNDLIDGMLADFIL